MSTGTLKAVFAALLIAAGLFLYVSTNTLPEQVASHFDAQGIANNTMSRNDFFLFMLGVTIGLPLLLVAGIGWLPNILPPQFINLPNRDYWLAPERRKKTMDFLARQGLWFGCIMVLFLCAINHLVIEANTSSPPHLPFDKFKWMIGIFLVALSIWIGHFVLRLFITGEKPGE